MVQLAEIAKSLSEIITLGYKIFALFAEAKRKGWISGGLSLTQQISGATNDEDRADLARRLFEHRAQ